MVIYQLDDGKIPAYRTCTEQVRQAKPKNVSYVLMGRTNHVPNCEDYRAASNILRCKLACSNDDMLWLDADILLDKWFDFPFKEGKVYFGTGNDGKPENWLFYVNGRSDFFRDMWKHFEETKPDHIWWFSRYVQSRRNEVELVPRGYFTHLMLSRAIFAGEYFEEQGNNRYSLSRDKIKNELLVEVR